jgi:hypothetical protein
MRFSYFDIKHLKSRYERWQTASQSQMNGILRGVVIPVCNTAEFRHDHVRVTVLYILVSFNGLGPRWYIPGIPH